ncbi:hypothetical protein GQ600_4633 [Phytophthora cactorum]|nr:hypothetical protein GQ600_4633 [Phytophthora cactorum]
MTVEIPFGPHASRFVEQFATRVLSKVDYGERGSADTFLMPTVSNSSLWSWWRNGVFVVKLAELNVLAITKREASLALQWISRHDFEEWTDDKLVDTYLQPLIAEIGALIAQHTRPGETVSSLLDVIDAFSRGISAPDSSAHSNFKRRASFDVVTNAQNSIFFFSTTGSSFGGDGRRRGEDLEDLLQCGQRDGMAKRVLALRVAIDCLGFLNHE